MIQFFLFAVQVSSKVLYYSSNPKDLVSCENISGCSLQELNSSVTNGTTIYLVDSILEKNQSLEFLSWVNATSSLNLTIIGNNTTFSLPSDFQATYPIILCENCNMSMSNITFYNVSSPILNGVNSTICLSNIFFNSSVIQSSSMLAFVSSDVIMMNCEVSNCLANSQSIIVGANSTILFDGFTSNANFMESRDIRAGFHFILSSITIRNGHFYSNQMKLPLFAASNFSSLKIHQSEFSFNNIMCLVAMEFNVSTLIYNTILRKNTGGLVAGGQHTFIDISKLDVFDQTSDEVLIGLSDSTARILDSSFYNSSCGGIVFLGINHTSHNMLINNTRLMNIQAKLSLFTSTGGDAVLSFCHLGNISSESEVVVFSHQNGRYSIIKDSKFARISSKSKVATLTASLNGTEVFLENIKFNKNAVCGGLFENISINIRNSSFAHNQCFPVGNSLPLAIITASLSNRVYIEGSLFQNNTALTGSVFLMNSSSIINQTSFNGNQAVQGAALFSAGSNVSVADAKFNENSAMSMGGAIYLTESNAKFHMCDFIGNQSPEGGVFSIKNAYNISIQSSNAKRNKATNGTLINIEGKDSLLQIIDTQVDDEVEKSIIAEFKDRIEYQGAKFNCRVKCQEIKSNKADSEKLSIQHTPMQSNQNEEKQIPEQIPDNDDIIPDNDSQLKIIWIIYPIILIALLILLRKFGKQGLTNFVRKLLKRKNKHTL